MNTNVAKIIYLRNKLKSLGDQIDIISDAPLKFLEIAEQIEALPKNSSKRAKLALDYLIDNQTYLKANQKTLTESPIHLKSRLASDGSKEEVYATADYADLITLGQEYKTKNFLNTAVWRTIYLLVNTIPSDEKRYQATWVETFIQFVDNAVLEFTTVDKVPGVTFNLLGSEHRALESGWGKGICDFKVYQDGRSIDGEFKKPTRHVTALAYYAFNDPAYIYNAKLLYTYGSLTGIEPNQFYVIDYINVDPTYKNKFSIRKLDIDFDATKLINAG
jgi:hypothetical protein